MPEVNHFRAVCAAELLKLRSLPATAITLGVTLVCTAGLSVLLSNTGDPASATDAALQTIQYAQIGFILLGALTIGSEYAGSQIQITLLSMPNRLALLAGKASAYMLTSLVAAVVVVTAAFLAARLSHHQPTGEVTALGGAVAYLVLIGLFAAAVTTMARHQVAAVVAMTSLVLIVSPLLRTITTAASYFPDSAGMQLYQSADDELTVLQGSAVLIAWLAVAHLAAAATFLKRDA
jgi:ABC-type transport system involved in multi-copper enzyme maturation permease subunit